MAVLPMPSMEAGPLGSPISVATSTCCSQLPASQSGTILLGPIVQFREAENLYSVSHDSLAKQKRNIPLALQKLFTSLYQMYWLFTVGSSRFHLATNSDVCWPAILIELNAPCLSKADNPDSHTKAGIRKEIPVFKYLFFIPIPIGILDLLFSFFTKVVVI